MGFYYLFRTDWKFCWMSKPVWRSLHWIGPVITRIWFKRRHQTKKKRKKRTKKKNENKRRRRRRSPKSNWTNNKKEEEEEEKKSFFLQKKKDKSNYRRVRSLPTINHPQRFFFIFSALNNKQRQKKKIGKSLSFAYICIPSAIIRVDRCRLADSI